MCGFVCLFSEYKWKCYFLSNAPKLKRAAGEKKRLYLSLYQEETLTKKKNPRETRRWWSSLKIKSRVNDCDKNGKITKRARELSQLWGLVGCSPRRRRRCCRWRVASRRTRRRAWRRRAAEGRPAPKGCCSGTPRSRTGCRETRRCDAGAAAARSPRRSRSATAAACQKQNKRNAYYYAHAVCSV